MVFRLVGVGRAWVGRVSDTQGRNCDVSGWTIREIRARRADSKDSGEWLRRLESGQS